MFLVLVRTKDRLSGKAAEAVEDAAAYVGVPVGGIIFAAGCGCYFA